ncbi:YdcF family protein [Candidatus Gracilibacteria bacterium]|nr:YdcF family protein [Candidatus Gracilibacteria bacterium]
MRKFLQILLAFGIFLMLPWGIISLSTQNRVYREVESIPSREVGLLLGTTPGINSSNLFFRTRIEATKELYERGKIRHILVSGDNGNPDYNEPEAMRLALIKAGIPNEDITLDYAGFRTLDSIVRAKEIFSLTGGITIISQPFHIERALFISNAYHIDAIGYGAANISLKFGAYPYIREIGARWIALYDVIFGTEPKVLGKKEKFNSGE